MVLLKKNWLFFIGLILTTSLLWPLFWVPYFSHHDDVQVIRLYEMSKCFADNQIPCRWVPDLGGLYGYPLFNYYAPLAYYFGEGIYFLTHSLLFSFKFMFAVSFLGSYIFMYLLASKFWGKVGGVLSAVFYSFAPYHALDFYVRGAMGEMWALMFYPMIFWAILRLNEKVNIRNMLILSLSMAGLMLSHNLSTMLFFPLTLVWIVMTYLKKSNMYFLKYSIFSLILAICLAAFYVLPVLTEKNLVHLETTIEGYFSYTEHFKGFKKLFIERTWGYGASVREVPGGEKDGLSYQIGWVHILSWLLSMFAAKVLWKRNKSLSIVIIFSSIVAAFSIFMINPRSDFLWKLIDPLKYLQFPWRFLMLTIFFISFTSGSISQIFGNRKKYVLAILFILVVALNFTYFKPEKFIQTSDEDLLTGANWNRQIMRSIFDYLPIYAKQPPANLASDRYEVLTGDMEVSDFKQGTNWFNFKTNTKTHSIIRLSQYYFPNWKVLVDGKQAQVEYKNNSLGLMTLILGKGNHFVEARLYNTQVRTLSNDISAVAGLMSMLLFILSFTRIRGWVAYYRKKIN